MTTKQKNIIEKNIELIGVKVGKSIKGKGLELFECDTVFDSSWSYGIEDGTFLKRVLGKIEKDPSVLERLFIVEFYDKEEKRYLKGTMPSIEEVLSGDALARCSEIRILKRGIKFYGYLPLGKYDAKSLDSMYQLVKDVNAHMGYKTLDEVLGYSGYEFDEVVDFQEENGWDKDRNNLRHIHGGLTAMKREASEVIDQDWKLDNYNDQIVDDFWNFDLENTQDYLKELDPEGVVSIYTYKGKKGHFGYSLQEEELYLNYLEDGEECEEYGKFLIWREDRELLNKMLEIFEADKKELEVKGYIRNELEDSDDGLFNSDLIEFMYNEDKQEFVQDLLELVNFKEVSSDWKAPERAVQKAYESWLEKNVVGKNDDGEYAHFVTLVENTGYKITETPIPNSNYVQKCVTYKGEEYHFMLAEFFNSETAEAFFEKVRDAISKRLIEKLEHTVLIQKSAHVFVGIQDSLESGNCNTGTMEFCHRHAIDTNQIGGLRGDVILSMEFSNFTRRAVTQAIVRQAS